MKKDVYINSFKNEITNAYFYLENRGFIPDEFYNELNLFFNEIKDFDIPEIYEKVNQKYGWYLKYYRETKRNSDISTIKAILKFFLILTIISIIIGIIIGISMATS